MTRVIGYSFSYNTKMNTVFQIHGRKKMKSHKFRSFGNSTQYGEVIPFKIENGRSFEHLKLKARTLS